MKTRIPRKATQALLIALLTSSTGLGVSSYVSAVTEKNFTSQAQGIAASASTIFDASQRLLPGDDGKVHLPSGTLGNSMVDYSKTTFNDGPITNLQTMTTSGFGSDAYTVPAGTTIKYYDTNGILINTWNVDKTINYYKNTGPLPVMACGIGGGHSYPNWFGGTFTPASSSDYTYLTINDIDYGDKVKVKKDQLYGYVIPDDSNLTLTDDGTYLTFTGIKAGVYETLKTASVVLVFNPGSYRLDYYSGIGVGGLVTFDNAKILGIVVDANVTAKYVDTDGNVISDNVIQSGNIGDTYTTEQKSIPGYTFKEVQGSATGTFTDQAQTVTYVYTKDPVAGGDVTAKYVDTDGNVISDNVIQSGNIGDAYTTEQKSVPGYTFKEVQGSASGIFTDKTQTVTYVYTKDPVAGGSVTAKYVDTDGNVISDNVIQSGNIGDAYTTEQKSIPGYTFKEVQGSVSGTFTDQAQTVTYVYTKDPVAGGSVTAKYVDTDGNVISDNVIQSGNVGDTYTTEQKSIPGYTFKEVQGSATGTFTDQSQTVTYVYTKDPVKPVAGGDVTARYVDTDGNVISDNVIQSGSIGDTYTTEQKSIPGYTFKEVQGSATGTFTDQAQTVTYVYTKDPVAGGDVTAKYVDTDGNVISDNVIQSGNIGDAYTTEQKSVPGYTFKEVQGSASGIFTDKTQTVTYVYTKDPVAGGSVTAKYVDTDGNVISDNVIQSGNIGDAYTTEQKSIPGYTFKEVQGSVSGTFTDQAQTVTYVYTKDPVAGGSVTAKYVDTDGNVISDNVIQSGNVGDTYTTEQKSIPGYTFKEVQGSATGTFTDQSQTVTYVYTKDPVKPVAGGDVTARYVDTDGNVISDNVIQSGSIGDTYTTEQKSIPGYTFKEVQGSATGTFTDQSQTVTYVYTKDPVKPVAGGDVTARYVDTDGNVISDNVIQSGSIGDTYTTEQKSIPGYTFKEVQGSASGIFTDKTQTVTYVYTKDPVAGGSVTAKYVDTDGNVISDNVIQSGNIGDAYTTEQKSIPGYTFKEVQGSVSGTFTDQAQTVTYVYTKDPVAGGSVTAKYVDTDGNVISDNVIQSGNVGDTYTTEQKSIPGYTFKEVQGSATGTFTDQSQTVTYVYTKDPVKPVAGGDVTARYVDTDGNVISDNVIQSGSIGDTYTTEQKSIPGYTFKEVQGSATGTFTDQSQTVTYVYTKDPVKPVAGGDVTARYVDTDGNVISDNVIQSGSIGDTYTTEQKSIPGYTFKEVQGSATGTFTDQSQTVTYVYTKIVSAVTPTPAPTNTSAPENSKTPTQEELPMAGENEKVSNIALVSGIALLGLGAIFSALRYKKKR